jgi:RNA polymerase sigma-70 factor (ECF subfamily)
VTCVEEVYRKYGHRVFRRCLRLVRNEAEAEDLTHEVFLRAIGAQSARPTDPSNRVTGFSALQIRDEEEAMAWLYRVATNLCLNRLRDRARRDRDRWRSEVRAVWGASDDGTSAHARGPDLAVMEGELALRIVSELDDELASLAIYYWVDEMNQSEIAKVMGLARGTVNRKLGEVARLLRARLEEALA